MEKFKSNLKDIIEKESTDLDTQDEAKEIQAFQNAHKYLEEFLGVVRDTGVNRLSEESRRKLGNMREMFLQVGEVSDCRKSNLPRESCNSGVKEKSKASNDFLLKETSCETGNTSSESSESHNSSSSDSNPSSISRASHKSTLKKRVKKIQSKNIDKLLAKIDNRRAPEIDDYDDASGETLEEYLDRFARYCDDNLKGDSLYWIPELEKHLSGAPLKALKSLKSRRDNYKQLKKKLIEWDRETKGTRKKKARNSFHSIKYEKKEDFFLFCNRLETQFGHAYPNKDAQYSSTLRDKLLQSAPKDLRKTVNRHIISNKVNNIKTTWKSIKKIAKYKDIEVSNLRRKDSSEDEREIRINVQQRSNTPGRNRCYSFNEGELHQSRYKKFESRNQDRGRNYNQVNSQYKRSTDSFTRPGNFQSQPRFGNDRYVHRNERYQPQHQARKSYPPQTEVRRQPGNGFQIRNPPEIPSCRYCKMIGHTFDTCRKRLNLCFRCAKPGHSIANCWYNNLGYTSQRRSLSQPAVLKNHKTIFQADNNPNLEPIRKSETTVNESGVRQKEGSLNRMALC